MPSLAAQELVTASVGVIERVCTCICSADANSCWYVMSSERSLQGRRRIKLGLKEVVNVGELTQHIDTATQHTVSTLLCAFLLCRTSGALSAHSLDISTAMWSNCPLAEVSVMTALCCVQKNVVGFDILLFGRFKGSLTIEAKYQAVSPCRVAITLEKAMLVPQQFQQLFDKNYNLLLSIFNPEGWLDITYVDAQHRIGRDDKGNVFVLERL